MAVARIAGDVLFPARFLLVRLDWDRDVMPVLQATYDAWTDAMTAGPDADPWVTGKAIDERLGRDEDDGRTAVVLNRLEDGALIEADHTCSISRTR